MRLALPAWCVNTWLVAVLACSGPSKHEVATARTARYNTDAATVLRAAFDVTSKLYPVLVVNEPAQTIVVEWTKYSTSYGYQRYRTGTAKQLLLRFEITIVGPRPWQIQITGQAAEKAVDELTPSPLPLDVEPGVVQERVNELYRLIYARIESYSMQ